MSTTGVQIAESEASKRKLRAAGEAHLWPGPYKPGDLSSEHAPKLVVGGAGPWVLDADNQTWFDSLSGMWLTNLGHGRREVADAVYAQLCELSYAPDGTVSPTTIRLADRIAALAPDHDSRIFFVSGSSEAVETAIKMARKYHRNNGEPGRFKLISRRGSYHGGTLGCLSLGGGGSNTGVEYGPLLTGAVRVQGPDSYRPAFSGGDLESAREIERAILNEGPETVAAVIGEPISASAGVHVPHPDYWPTVRSICDRYGVLLILDEVITAFGRTGKMFASEHWGVVPDITTVAKGLTAGYVPIGAAIASKRVADAFTGGHPSFNHRFTFGGNPGACAAGLATLAIIEREGLVENSRLRGQPPDVLAARRRAAQRVHRRPRGRRVARRGYRTGAACPDRRADRAGPRLGSPLPRPAGARTRGRRAGRRRARPPVLQLAHDRLRTQQPWRRKLLDSGFEHALIPVDELLPALYMPHPRADVRRRYPPRLSAYACEPPLVEQLPKDVAGSDTEATAFVSGSVTDATC